LGNPRDQQSCPNKGLSDSASPQMAIESLVMALAMANWHDAGSSRTGEGRGWRDIQAPLGRVVWASHRNHNNAMASTEAVEDLSQSGGTASIVHRCRSVGAVARSCLTQNVVLNPESWLVIQPFLRELIGRGGQEGERCCVSRIEFAGPCERPPALAEPCLLRDVGRANHTRQGHGNESKRQQKGVWGRGKGKGRGRGRGRNDVKGTVSWTYTSPPSARRPWRPTPPSCFKSTFHCFEKTSTKLCPALNHAPRAGV
jgi:hypothetical protein